MIAHNLIEQRRAAFERELGGPLIAAVWYARRRLAVFLYFVAALGGALGMNLVTSGLERGVGLIAAERAAWETSLQRYCVPKEARGQARIRYGTDGLITCVEYGPNTAPDAWREKWAHAIIREALTGRPQ